MEESPEMTVLGVKAIEEAIEELLTNCIVHSDRVNPTPTVTFEETPETVRIRIVDENRPIPVMDRHVLSEGEELNRLHHGSGLGLWLVKLIVDHSDGTVEYEARDPRGNEITIELSKP